MSGSSSDQLATIIADFCTCHLCKNIFKHPIILSCFHSFCSECLDQHSSQQNPQEVPQTLSCPVCSSRGATADAAITSSPDQPRDDTFIENLLMVVETIRGDKECAVCQRLGEHHVASCWCVDCCDTLCQNCLKVHLFGRTTSNHKILSMSELQQLPLQSVMRGTSTQTCSRHQEDVVKMFCLDCGQPVCVQCLAAAHKKCDRCVPVSEARMLIQDDVTEVMARLQAEVTEDSKEQAQHQSGLNTLEQNIQQTEAQIRTVAKDLRQKITECEEALIEKLRSVSSSLTEKASDVQTMTECGSVSVRTLAVARKRMTAILKYGNDLDVLDIYHRVKDTLLNVTAGRSKASSSDTVRLKVSFDIDDAVRIFSRDLEKLGEVRVEDLGHDEGLSSWGVAVTSRDEIVVTNGRHKRVQKFTSSGSLVDHIQLSEEPRGITSFGRYDVAITVTKKQILVMAVFGKLELQRRVETQKQYDGIAFSPTLPGFLVSSVEQHCIDLITKEGNITETFSINESTLEPVFSCPRFVFFTKEGHFVISDTAHNSVTCISQDGALLFTYAPSDGAHSLKRVQGVCCDKNGNVFVADYGNSRIHLLASDGNFQRFVLGHNSELRRPVALTMTEGNKLVVVQSDGMVKIFSYEGNQAESGEIPNGQLRQGRHRFQSNTPSSLNQAESGEIPNGQLGQGRHRFQSNTPSSLNQAEKSNRRFSESSSSRPAAYSHSPHTFRSRHF